MKKLHTLPLVAALLLAPPALLASNFPLMPAAVHAAAQQDTIKESMLPPKAASDKDAERSVKAPVPWLLVEDHRIEALNANGKCVTYSSHPVLHVKGEGRETLSRALDAWNKHKAQAAKRASISPMNARTATAKAASSKKSPTSTTLSSRSGGASTKA